MYTHCISYASVFDTSWIFINHMCNSECVSIKGKMKWYCNNSTGKDKDEDENRKENYKSLINFRWKRNKL